MRAPIPRPTEVEHNRIRCGQRKSRTIEEINYDIEFQMKIDRENLRPTIE